MRNFTLAISLFALLISPALAGELQPFSVKAISGDTLTLLNPQTNTTLPVKAQPGHGKDFRAGQTVMSDGQMVLVMKSPHQLLREKMRKK